MANLKPLQDALKLLADAALDVEKAVHDTNPASRLAEFTNLLPDLMTLAPEIGDLPASANGLTAADYATLVSSLAADLGGLPAKAATVVNAGVPLLNTIFTQVVPQAKAIAAALKAA